MNSNELIAYIFGGTSPTFAPLAARWLADSPTFQTFAETYRDKIRKKVRQARDEDSSRDLQAELAVAGWLLRDRRLALEYEPYAATGRGPDFGVVWRTHSHFTVEVTRLRDVPAAPDLAALAPRVAGTISGKLPQLPPSIANLLVLVADSPADLAAILHAGLAYLAARAAADDDSFFARHGIPAARDYRRAISRLSALAIRPPAPAAPTPGRTGCRRGPPLVGPRPRAPPPPELQRCSPTCDQSSPTRDSIRWPYRSGWS